MTRLIPNENTFLGFALTIANLSAPTAVEVTGAANLSSFLMSVNASTTGNTVPTPALDSLFETSIAGTVTGSFTADFYRDDTTDTAWTTLPRKTKGFVILSRFGGSGTNARPIAGDTVEIWPILVVSRTNSNSASNQVITFTVTASIPVEPVEDATVT
jgi:hypothetical protein